MNFDIIFEIMLLSYYYVLEHTHTYIENVQLNLEFQYRTIKNY